MIQNVNATRMELLALRKRVALALRGHRLLSEKRDEICRQLVQIARDLRDLRSRVERDLLETSRRFMMARAVMEPEHIRAALDVPSKTFKLAVSFASIMSVQVPRLAKEIAGDILCYGFSSTSGELDAALRALERAFDGL
ncbi:MAG TPA: V-type ATP synthase subunit D, partial [Anaerohalosphaeraceae bacterium]|nr:V-type ATP synthase subunit D [Anaerohalosphaeraceae bacterium]